MGHFRLALLLVVGGVPLFAQNPVLDSIQVLGGSGRDNVVSLTPDNAGNIFVLGSTESPDFPATKVFGPGTSPSSGGDTFVAKIRLADWSLAWSAVFRPSVPLSLAIDPTGAVYVTCYTSLPPGFPATPAAFVSTYPGGGPLSVIKLDPTGTQIVFSSQLATYEDSTAAPIAVDSQGQAYIAAKGIGPITPGAFIPAITSGTPGAYVAKLSADGGTVVFCTYLNSSATTTPNAIAVDSQQDVFVAGADSAQNSNFPSTTGVIQPAHNGDADAFVMKFNPDGTSLEFATLLGGAGSASAAFLQIASGGAIYLAGSASFSSVKSFPTTVNSGLSSGFVAKLSPDASSLLFSTYASTVSNAGVQGFGIAGGLVYAAYPILDSKDFLGLDSNTPAQFQSTAVQVFDAGTGAVTAPAYQIPALTPDGFIVSDSDLVVASNASQINLPVPATITPLGPPGLDPNKNPLTESGITLVRFLLNATPDHDIDTDRGYLYFESYPGAILPQIVNVTSAAGAFPFHVFSPISEICCSPAPPYYAAVPQDAVTPAAVTISPGSPDTYYTPAFLLVSPHASQPIQVLPAHTYVLPFQLTVPDFTVVLPQGGGPGAGTIQVSAAVSSPASQALIPVSVPFQFDSSSLPTFLTLDPSQGATPATVNVTAQIDSLQPGASQLWRLYITAGNILSKEVHLFVTRPGPQPLVKPTSIQLYANLGDAPPSTTLQVTPPDNTTGFQILPLPSGIHVSPSSGAGPTTLTVTADPSQFSLGFSNLTFTIQVGTTQVVIAVSMQVAQLSSGLNGPGNIVPGLRATISELGVAPNLPSTGSWADVSPAPTNWNGYSFVYRSRTLSILAADPATLQFDIQFPYDLDLTGQIQPVNFVAPDSTIVSVASTNRTEAATAIVPYNSGFERPTAFKSDGSAVSSANPVIPGDTIRVPIVGAGVTNPPIATGLLPSSGAVLSPTAAIEASIGGVTATVARQVLDPQFIGVTDVYIAVPNLASGLEMLGMRSGVSSTGMVPIWTVGVAGRASQNIIFGPMSNDPLGTPAFTLTVSASSGLPVSFSSQTGSVCTLSNTTLSLLAVGTCTIQATQSGNVTYLAAPAVIQSFQVTQPTSTACPGTGSRTPGSAIQPLINEALGVSTVVHDLNGDGSVNLVDVQIMARWAVGLGCSASH